MSSLKATTDVPYMPVDTDYDLHLGEPTFSEWCAVEHELDSIEAEYLAEQAGCAEHYYAYLMHKCRNDTLESLFLKPQPTRSELGCTLTDDFPF